MSWRGRSALITRTASDASNLVDLLKQRGARVVVMPTIVRGPPDDKAQVAKIAATIDTYDAIAVGSAAALRPVAAAMHAPTRVLMACVGAKTAKTLEVDAQLAPQFLGPRLVPPTYRAESLVEALVGHFGTLVGKRFCVPRAPEGRDVLGAGLRDAGADVDEVVTYRILPAAPPARQVWQQAQSVDAALFLSGQTLANLLVIVPEAEARAFLARTKVGVIGPIAASRADALGIRVDAVAPTATQEALVDAVETVLASTPLKAR
ncbi:MAG: uroporphyrinogen-III synthase [Myxococcota bacterium]